MIASQCPDWIAVDRRGKKLRAWAMADDNTVLATLATSESTEGLDDPGDFEPALLNLIAPWLDDKPVDVIACGPVDRTGGETGKGSGDRVAPPLRPVPCPVRDIDPLLIPSADPRIRIRIVPGLRQDRPADVMRGAETTIAGYLSKEPAFDGVICLPGASTHWAHISAGEVVSFRSFLTFDLFTILAQHSLLRSSLGRSGWDDATFAEAVDEALTRPERLASLLYSVHARDLLQGRDGLVARSRLAGYLVGAELAAARPYWLGQPVTVIASVDRAQIYSRALTRQGLTPRIADETEMTLAGLAGFRGGLDLRS